MCLLTFYPAYLMPNVDALSNGAYINNDGHGFAIVADQYIIVRRGMNADQMIEYFVRMRSKYPDGPALFHSRLGTHGSIGKRNCHPFRIGTDPRTVLAHNGILPKNVQPRKGDKRCDTRIAAKDFLPHNPFGPLESSWGRDRLTQWLGRKNKFVILTVDPHCQKNAYILNEQYGVWEDGVWYSNDDYRPLPLREEWLHLTMNRQICSTCHLLDTIDLCGYCMVCGTCSDCSEPDGYCYCYAPAKIPN
jgi:hypothetical protein